MYIIMNVCRYLIISDDLYVDSGNYVDIDDNDVDNSRGSDDDYNNNIIIKRIICICDF